MRTEMTQIEKYKIFFNNFNLEENNIETKPIPVEPISPYKVAASVVSSFPISESRRLLSLIKPTKIIS